MGRLWRTMSRALGGTVRGAVRASGRAPRLIFTYHSVGEGEGAVPAAVLEEQIVAARRAGYHWVSLSQMTAWQRGRGDLPGQAVAMTFDDGLANTARVAAPLLRRLQVPATVFPVLEFLGGPRRYASERARGMLLHDDGDAATRGWDYMSWEELDLWVEAGGEVGGHTLTHPFLTDLDEVTGMNEVSGCRQRLESRYGRPPAIFCYPFGDAGGGAPLWARRAGFTAAVTTGEGQVKRESDPFLLPRVPATPVAGAAFEDLLFGIFDWRRRLRTALPGGRP